MVCANIAPIQIIKSVLPPKYASQTCVIYTPAPADDDTYPKAIKTTD